MPITKVLAFALLLAACSSPPKFQSPDSQIRVNHILASYQGKADLNGFIGVAPSTCLKSSDTSELCEWRLGDRTPGWATLALEALGP